MTTSLIQPLAGQVALVTGAARGIGAEVALRLATAGAAVVVNDLDSGPLEEVLHRIKVAGGSAVPLAQSVTASGFGSRAVSACVDTFGSLDIVVNNAGYTWDAMLHKMTDEQWQAMLDVHLTAPFKLLRAAYPVFKEQFRKDHSVGRVRHRKVVNVSSIVGVAGNIGQSNYAAAKGGVQALTRSLSKEWGGIGVNVNCVAFGQIDTRLTQERVGTSHIHIDGREIPVGISGAMLERVREQIPLGRGGTVAEAASAIHMFCGPESDYISGQVLICGGGLSPQ